MYGDGSTNGDFHTIIIILMCGICLAHPAIHSLII